jgi:hypothetical protein
MKILFLAILASQIGACCGGMKDAVHAYGSAAEDSAQATAELVKRCKAASGEPDGEGKNQDLAACDRAIQSLEVQKVAAGRLKGE